MVPIGKAQERFHVVFQATKVIYPRRFMKNACKFYHVNAEKLSPCQIYDVLKKQPYSQGNRFGNTQRTRNRLPNHSPGFQQGI